MRVRLDGRTVLMLVDDHGLDLDAVEQWITSTTIRAVLRRELWDE